MAIMHGPFKCIKSHGFGKIIKHIVHVIIKAIYNNHKVKA